MAGLRKAKKYDWKDSNLALFGSDKEKQVKKESAMTEPAWKGAGGKVGLKIWRIVKFKVTDWPTEDYGKFFNGDSYIILNTYKEDDSDELKHDVHFWIGKESTQDEYGTAAYKTVELDTFLDDLPVQHREVQNHESDLFKSYFKSITILKGGADTGFRHVKPIEYTQRLFHFSGQGRNIQVKEVPRSKDRLNSGDVFILDAGLELYQWNGKGSSKDERFKAMQYIQQLNSERNGKPNKEVLEEEDLDASHKFYTLLDEDDENDDEPEVTSGGDKKLFRLSDESGKLDFRQEKTGDIAESDLDSKDVFIIDTLKSVLVWIGKGATDAERKNGMSYAHQYLMTSPHPLLQVSVFKEGTNNDFKFRTALTA